MSMGGVFERVSFRSLNSHKNESYVKIFPYGKEYLKKNLHNIYLWYGGYCTCGLK